MTISLLRTKLYVPPIRSELVSRPRLIERLDAGRHGRLTLLSAPAGFGKTTLLSEWVTQSKDWTAWLSLDKEDNDSVRFWTRFVKRFSELLMSGELLASEIVIVPKETEYKTKGQRS